LAALAAALRGEYEAWVGRLAGAAESIASWEGIDPTAFPAALSASLWSLFAAPEQDGVPEAAPVTGPESIDSSDTVEVAVQNLPRIDIHGGVAEVLRSPSSTSLTALRRSTSTLASSTLTDEEDGLPAGAIPGHLFTEPSTPDSATNVSTGAMLPADDGKHALRQRVITIQSMDLSAVEKARLMHALMNERYHHAQAKHHRRPDRQNVPASDVDAKPECNVGASTSHSHCVSLSAVLSGNQQGNPYQVGADDLKPSYVPVRNKAPRHGRSQSSQSDSEDADLLARPRSLGCQHYKRNVKLQCSTCNRWYPCRFCHDEAEDHRLIRRETKHMLCMLCGCAQPAGDVCANCGERTAWYYCGICKLWDDDNDKSIYHCNDCGICRIGRGLGKDFFHCKVCPSQFLCAYGPLLL
jgi:uncharacterized CHY-type Zn-finger protein